MKFQRNLFVTVLIAIVTLAACAVHLGSRLAPAPVPVFKPGPGVDAVIVRTPDGFEVHY